LAVPHPHALADAGRGHARADLVDDAAAVAVRDDAWCCHRPPGRPGARLDVRRVDAGGDELDPHLARHRLGRLRRAAGHRLARSTVAFIPGSAHAMVLLFLFTAQRTTFLP